MILTIALVSIALVLGGDRIFTGKGSDHIARVTIDGVIVNDKVAVDFLKKLEKDDHVKGVILAVSSPGGSTVGGEALYEAIRSLAEKKPVVTSVGTLAASAGYMIAAASDHIVARRSSIVGSIGVLFQYVDATELLGKVGVKVESIKSAPLKAEPSPFNATTEEERRMIDNIVRDSYEWFVELVSERRALDGQDVAKLADGSIFTGAQGLQNGLIDAIGGEEVAKKWLIEERGLKDSLKIIDRKPRRPGDGLFVNPVGMQRIARHFGIDLNQTEALELERTLKRLLLLDGLVSIWQVSGG